MRCLMLATVLLMTACATPNFKPAPIATPHIKLFHYSAAFQDKFLTETKNLPEPCARDVVTAHCSAVRRIRNDYAYDRNQMRILNIPETE